MQVPSWLQASNNTGILSTYTRLWLAESEQSTPCRFNKGRGSKFRVGSRVQPTPEKGRRIYRPKRCEYNNKDEDNSPKTLNDENQASSQKFRQLKHCYWKIYSNILCSLTSSLLNILFAHKCSLLLTSLLCISSHNFSFLSGLIGLVLQHINPCVTISCLSQSFLKADIWFPVTIPIYDYNIHFFAQSYINSSIPMK